MKKILVCLLVLISLVGVSSAFNYTIDGTGYNFGQQFNATSGAGTVVLNDYQIRVNLSTNLSSGQAYDVSAMKSGYLLVRNQTMTPVHVEV